MEFVDVMFEQRRMCASMKDCDDCPLHGFSCSPDNCRDKEDLCKYEDIVMTWAQKNPRYPTVGELFDTIKRDMGYGDGVKFDAIADYCIPQNVARELGIMPLHVKYEKGE